MAALASVSAPEGTEDTNLDDNAAIDTDTVDDRQDLRLLSPAPFTPSLPPTPLRGAGLNNRPLPAAVTGRNTWLSSLAGPGPVSAKQAAFAAIGAALRGVNADGGTLVDPL